MGRGATLDVTVPELTRLTVSVGVTAVKFAVTVVFAVSVRVHVLLEPLHPPGAWIDL